MLWNINWNLIGKWFRRINSMQIRFWLPLFWRRWWIYLWQRICQSKVGSWKFWYFWLGTLEHLCCCVLTRMVKDNGSRTRNFCSNLLFDWLEMSNNFYLFQVWIIHLFSGVCYGRKYVFRESINCYHLNKIFWKWETAKIKAKSCGRLKDVQHLRFQKMGNL